jgi:hypothetical protein
VTHADAIIVVVTDRFGNASANQTGAVTVNGVPVITAPANAAVGVAHSNPIAGISLSESGNTTGELFTITPDRHAGGADGVSGTGPTGSTTPPTISQGGQVGAFF